MITEEHLSTLLEDAAAAFDPPTYGPARIVAAATTTPSTKTRTFVARQRLAVAGAVMVAGTLLTTALVVNGSGDNRTETAAVADQKGATEAAPAVDAVGDAASAPLSSEVRTVPNGAVEPAPSAASLAKIVKTGSIDVAVRSGRVEDALEQITGLATTAGGFVSTSATTETSRKPRANVNVRVPAVKFEDLVHQVRGLGKVERASTSGADVTGEYTDIEARLRTLTAERDSLRTVLSQARAIGDILAVRDRITQVQTQIEQLQGRQQVLDDQVGFGTLDVVIHEPGDAVRSPKRSAWDRAVSGFTSTWGTVLANSGAVLAALLGLVILGAALFAGGRWAWRLYLRARG